VKKTFIAGAVALLSLAGTSAFAQTYVGINLGQSHANRACDAGAAIGLLTGCDKDDFAWKINGGYQLPGTPWAGELTYFNLGKFKGTGPTASGTAKDSYWGIGGVDPDTYQRAEAAGRVAQDIPVNHSARFAPVIQPTLDTGTEALVVAALAWLTPSASR